MVCIIIHILLQVNSIDYHLCPDKQHRVYSASVASYIISMVHAMLKYKQLCSRQGRYLLNDSSIAMYTCGY